MRKRILSLLLCLCMAAAMLPTVALAADTTPPAVTGVTPGGTDVPVSGDIAITFNEAMNTTVAGAVYLSADSGTTYGSALTGGSWSASDTVYTIPYSGLSNSTAYTVKIEGFQDTDGNTLAVDSAHSFTTCIGSDFTVTGGTLDTDYTYLNGVLTFTAPGDYTVSMASLGATTTTNKIVVNASGSSAANPVKIILDGVKINVSGTSGAGAFDIMNGSTVSLTLSGTNTLQSASNTAGLHVPTGASLIIGGDGTLTATGGNNGAGIGGNMNESGGAVTITGGTVNANGGEYSAGIGGGRRGNGGNVIITGGTVTANGQNGSAGIGSGSTGAGGMVNISGGTVTATGYSIGIGGGSSPNISGGTITISGGTITAVGGDAVTTSTDSAPVSTGGGAGIGGGCYGGGGNVYISGGSVKAVHGVCTGTGTSAEDIGKGYAGASDGCLKNLDTAEGVNVYLTELTLTDADNNPIADTSIQERALVLDDTAAGYGKNDLRTDADGTLYFYLPANNASAEYGGKLYTASVGAVHSNVFTFAGFRTSMSVENISGYEGKTVTLTALVEALNPVNEGEVEFKVNGVIAGTASVSNGVAALNWTIPSDWSAKSYPIVADYSGAGNFTAGTGSGTLTVPKRSSDDGSGSTPSKPAYTANVIAGNGVRTPLPVTVNTDTGNATVNISAQQGNAISGGGNVTVTMPSIPGVSNYTLGIPAACLTTPSGGSLTFETDTGSITLPADMLAGISEADGKNAEITIGQGDKSGLPDDVKAAIGDRPLISLSLLIDGKQTDWSNPDAPVTVSIPYTPTAAELANPESIVVWYIDGSGNVVTVPNGHYDAATGMVTFETTHFSHYAVAYNKVSFNDVSASAWYSKAVSFVAAREMSKGTGGGNYSPEAKLTRGEFIVLMMRAYGIAPDANPQNNFADAGSTYYTGYLAAAKRLGITAGVGNNMYAPGNHITRQEMFTLLYNALKVIDRLPYEVSGKQLSSFTDSGSIAVYAQEAMAYMVKAGVASGNNGYLLPASTTTRAQMAQVLYNLMGK